MDESAPSVHFNAETWMTQRPPRRKIGAIAPLIVRSVADSDLVN